MRQGLKALKEQQIVYLAMAGFILVLAALLFLFFSRESRQTRLSMQYEADRVATSLLVRYLRDDLADGRDLTRPLLGFGVYNEAGAPLLLYGSAPHRLPRGGDGQWARFQVTRTRVVLVRPAGMAPLMPGMPHMMARPSPSAPSRLLPMFHNAVYLEMERSYFSGDSGRLRLTLLFIFLLVTLIMAALGYVYTRNRRYRQKEESQRQLVQLGEAARTLVHEIRNPLGSIRIQSRLLEKKLPPGEQGHIRIINQEVERLKRLSTRVGEFLRNPAGNPVAIDLHAYLRGLSRRLDYPVRLSPGAGGARMIVFDRDRLPSVCENIIRNAYESARGAPRDAQVEVVLKEEDGYVIMEVLDRGAGIPARDRERVFDPFYTTKSEGSGIGLSTARRLVEATGGRILIGDRDGGGTSVKVFFRKEEQHA
jgi:two-component system sensor histidine kinase HydH